MDKKKMVDKTSIWYELALHYQECLIKNSDINYKLIGIKQAKYILGSMKRVPEFLQNRVLHGIEEMGLIKINKFNIDIIKD